MTDRFVPVFWLRSEDDRRRWFVVDLEPSAEARAGTVIAELHSEGHAAKIAAALNRQPPPASSAVAEPELGVAERAVSPYIQPFLQPSPATVPDGPDAF